jgi:hypothetical protein
VAGRHARIVEETEAPAAAAATRLPPAAEPRGHVIAVIGFSMTTLFVVYHLVVNWLGTNGDLRHGPARAALQRLQRSRVRQLAVARLPSYLLP